MLTKRYIYICITDICWQKHSLRQGRPSKKQSKCQNLYMYVYTHLNRYMYVYVNIYIDSFLTHVDKQKQSLCQSRPSKKPLCVPPQVSYVSLHMCVFICVFAYVRVYVCESERARVRMHACTPVHFSKLCEYIGAVRRWSGAETCAMKTLLWMCKDILQIYRASFVGIRLFLWLYRVLLRGVELCSCVVCTVYIYSCVYAPVRVYVCVRRKRAIHIWIYRALLCCSVWQCVAVCSISGYTGLFCGVCRVSACTRRMHSHALSTPRLLYVVF